MPLAGLALGVAGEKSLYHVLGEGMDPTEVAVPVRFGSAASGARLNRIP